MGFMQGRDRPFATISHLETVEMERPCLTSPEYKFAEKYHLR